MKAHKGILLVLIEETAVSLDMHMSDVDGLEKKKKKKLIDLLYSNAKVDTRCALFKHLITTRNLRELLKPPPKVLRSGKTRQTLNTKRKSQNIHRGNNEQAIARREETERMEQEAKKEQMAADQLLLNAAKAHLEGINRVNQAGSLFIPPSKYDECRTLYTRATEIQQSLINVVHDEEGKNSMLSNLQRSMLAMQSRCRGVTDWKSAVAPEGFRFHESQYVPNIDSSGPAKRRKKEHFDSKLSRGLRKSMNKGEKWCKDVTKYTDMYTESRKLRYA